MPEYRTCTIPDCTKKMKHLSGLCGMHYERRRVHGDPLISHAKSLIPPVERFWAKVNKTETCWVWTASTQRFGYGAVANRPGSPIPAHRYSWELHYGKIPPDTFVLHKCDNPPCVRPDHLFLGTQTDNMRDCVQKGRHRGGFYEKYITKTVSH